MSATLTKLTATATRSALLSGLGAVGGVITTRTVLPALSHVRIEATPDGLTLTCTNLDTHASVKVPGEGEGAFLLPAKPLSDWLKLAPDGPVRLVQDGGKITVTAGRSRATFDGLGVDEWPGQPTADTDAEVAIDAAALHDLAARVAFAASSEESRPILNGVFVEIRPGGVTMTATNGHRLGNVEAKASGVDVEADLIVHPSALDVIARIVPDGEVRLSWSANYLHVSGEHGSISARLIEGPYPNYRQVVPAESSLDKWLTVDRKALIAAVRRATVVSTAENKRVVLTMDASGVEVATDQAGHAASDSIEAGYEGEAAFRIAFNGEYLTEMLPRVTTEAVRLGFSSSERAALILPEHPAGDDPAARYIVMPLRLLD